MVTYELKSQTSVTSRGGAHMGSSVRERDNAHLQRMGKKPVLKVCNAILKATMAIRSEY